VTGLSPESSKGEGDIGWKATRVRGRVGERINEGRERAQVGEATDELLVGGGRNRKNQGR
jgi:hypothetical protein